MSDQDLTGLRKELVGMFEYIQVVRQEIAAIDRPTDDGNQFKSMSDQLDAIVEATETATNTIIEIAEKNDELIEKLRDQVTDPGPLALIDEISINSMGVFEACSFQDITGQRITKVVTSLQYIEDRVNKLISVWGKSDLDKVEVKADKEKTEDEKLLQGPQHAGQGVSQEEIDKLFD